MLSVTDQVNEFLSTVASKPASTPWTSANSLFSVWIGVNDIGNSYYASGDRGAYGRFIICLQLALTTSFNTRFSDTLLNAEFALIQKLVRHVPFAHNSMLILYLVQCWRKELPLGQRSPNRSLSFGMSCIAGRIHG